jgi:hypothetical protein
MDRLTRRGASSRGICSVITLPNWWAYSSCIGS